MSNIFSCSMICPQIIITLKNNDRLRPQIVTLKMLTKSYYIYTIQFFWLANKKYFLKIFALYLVQKIIHRYIICPVYLFIYKSNIFIYSFI